MLGFENASKATKVTRSLNAVAAGTTDQNGPGIDMANFETVMFLFMFGTITGSAVTSCKVQTSDQDGSPDTYTDLVGTSLTVADDDDNQIGIIEIVKPRERYVRPFIVRGTQNAVIDGIVAIQFGPKKAPTTHDSSTVLGTETHISVAEGTA